MCKERRIVSMVLLVVFLMNIVNISSVRAEEVDEPKNLALGLKYEMSQPPRAPNPDDTYILTDGIRGSLSFNTPEWQRHLRGIDRSITFDLGSEKSISKMSVNFLKDKGSGIHLPEFVEFYVSNDNENWALASHKEPVTKPWVDETLTEEIFWSVEDGLPVKEENAELIYARYVKVYFPVAVWIFLDEIEIWGFDEKVDNAVVLPPTKAEDEEDRGYLMPGETTAGIDNLVLMYNGWYESGKGNWSKEDMVPYLAYVDNQGNPQDWFFDGVLLLALNAESGRSLYGKQENPSDLEDWKWYLDKTFAKDGELDNLNRTVAELGEKLGDSNHKLKVVLTIPYPSTQQSNFGDVDGDGVSESFDFEDVGHEEAFANRRKAVDWYIAQILQRWEKSGYDNLELKGMYWMKETVTVSASYEKDLLSYTGEKVRDAGLKFFWIPYYGGEKFHEWDSLGFNATAVQPNHMFKLDSDETRIKEAAEAAKKYGMGVEIEATDAIVEKGSDIYADRRKRYLNYLEGGVKYGYMGAFNAYYQGSRTYARAAGSEDNEIREIYDITYQFAKGKYKEEPIVPEEPVKGSIKITVRDGDGNPLEGAKFRLVGIDEENKAIEYIGITDRDGILELGELLYGKYKLKQLETPEGYILDEADREIVIETQDEVVEVEVENKKKEEKPVKGSIKITVRDGDGNPLEGAKFSLVGMDEGNKDIEHILVTDRDGILEFGELLYGKYTLKQLEAPEGYILDKADREIVIETQDEVVEVEVENKKEEEKPVIEKPGTEKPGIEKPGTEKPGDNKGAGVLPKTGENKSVYVFFTGMMLLLAGVLLWRRRSMAENIKVK